MRGAEHPRELRVAGLCYLAIAALGLWTDAFVRGSLVVAGNAAATAQNITPIPSCGGWASAPIC